jgi:hypothetical protein
VTVAARAKNGGVDDVDARLDGLETIERDETEKQRKLEEGAERKEALMFFVT